MDFSETIADADLKVGRCRQHIEFVKLYVRIQGLGHFMTLAKGHLKLKLALSKSTGPFLTKFCM